MKKLTKQELKDQAYKAHRATLDLAWKTYAATEEMAQGIYLAKLRKIDKQGEDIKIIDGKKYKLVDPV